MMNNPIYLGDSVYAGTDDSGRIWIWTDNGFGPQKQICLEPEVLEAFDLWRNQLPRLA